MNKYYTPPYKMECDRRRPYKMGWDRKPPYKMGWDRLSHKIEWDRDRSGIKRLRHVKSE